MKTLKEFITEIAKGAPGSVMDNGVVLSTALNNFARKAGLKTSSKKALEIFPNEFGYDIAIEAVDKNSDTTYIFSAIYMTADEEIIVNTYPIWDSGFMPKDSKKLLDSIEYGSEKFKFKSGSPFGPVLKKILQHVAVMHQRQRGEVGDYLNSK
jgi:hypothetical protein